MISADQFIKLNVLRHMPPLEPFGTFVSPVNLSLALDNTKQNEGFETVGLPLGWCVRGPVAGNGFSQFLQKAGGVPIALSSFANDGAYDSTIVRVDAGPGSFSWIDGPAGANATGTASQGLARFASNIYDGGFYIDVPALPHPDWCILRVFSHCGLGNRSEEFVASIAGDPAVQTKQENIKGNSSPQQNADWANSIALLTEYKFCSKQQGQTFRVKLRSTYEYFTGIYAVQLFRAKLAARPTGLATFMAANYSGPLGAR